jgi:hypothetical protein
MARLPKAAVGTGRAGRAEGLGNDKGKDDWRWNAGRFPRMRVEGLGNVHGLL